MNRRRRDKHAGLGLGGRPLFTLPLFTSPWLLALLLLLPLASLPSCGGADRTRRPHVLVITLDTTRADRFAAYGQTGRSVTPRLDAFARRGVVFRESFSNSSFTPPSHGSIFTGRYPSEHGLMHWSDTLGPVTTAAEYFAAAGYRTLAITPLKTLFRLGLGRGFADTREPPHKQGDGLLYMADAETINALALPELIGPHETPFFAWLHYYDAHRVFGRQGPEWAERFGTHDDPQMGGTEAFYQLTPKAQERLALTPDDVQFIKDRYDGGLAYLDEQVGRLLEQLDRAGVLEDTIVVITADHGEVFDEHHEQWFSHDPYLVEENLRVPLFIHLPGDAHAGLVVPDMVQGIDILPTLLSLAQLDEDVVARPSLLSGLDLSPTLEGRALHRDFVYAERRGRDRQGEDLPAAKIRRERDRRRMLRSTTHKLIQASDRGTTQLFELGDEHRDLSAEQPELFRDMLAAYQSQLLRLQTLSPDGSTPELDPETLRMLTELGYLGLEAPR